MKKLFGCLLAFLIILLLAFAVIAGMVLFLWRDDRDTPSVSPPQDPPQQSSSQPEKPPDKSGEPADDGADNWEERYIYQQLDSNAQALYRRMAQAIRAMEDGVRITAGEAEALGERKLFDIFTFVLDDYPEFFWLESALRTQTSLLDGAVAYTDVTFHYLMTESQRDSYQSQIDKYERECLQGLPADVSAYDAILHVYEYIIDHTDYVLDSPHNQNILSVFLYGESVCSGYAKATQYLLGRLNIPCTTITGVVTGAEAHAWNLVLADGEYYFLDTTWGDPVFMDSGASNADNLSYDYFMVTSEDAAKTHVPDGKYVLPRCVATACNYYVAEGRMLAAYDLEAVAGLMAADVEAGRNRSTFRFESGSAYREALADLFDNGQIFPVLRQAADKPEGELRVTYSVNEELYIITVNL